MSLLTLVYTANIAVAGWVGLSCLFSPRNALTTVFTGAFEYSEAIRLVGALWTAIAILSLVGLFYPVQMALVLVLQLCYKASWLIAVALPAVFQKKPLPAAMAIFFLIWIIVLPFVIPWQTVFA